MVTEDNEFVIHGPPSLEPLPNLSLGKLIYDSLIKDPSTKEAFVDALTKKSITYQQFLGKTCSLAASLLQSGYGKDTIISISSENNVDFYVPVASALYVGAIVAPINHNYTEQEMAHCLNITKPQLLFCSKEVCEKFVRLKQKFSCIQRIIVIDSIDKIAGADTLTSFLVKNNHHSNFLYTFQPTKFDADDQVAFILCSSGTTGLPKGVMLTHTNVLVRYYHTIDDRYVVRHKSFLGILPFFHGYGLVTNLFAMVTREKVVVLKKFEEELFLRCIQEYKISTLWLAPPLILFLAKHPLVDQYDLSSVSEIVSGGAPLSLHSEELIKKRLNVKSVRQGYGLTEATLAIMIMTLGESLPGSSGKVVTYMSCKVRDPQTGKSLGPYQVGEICVKGPMVMKGYYGDEEATKNSFTSDGWLLSGDLGYYDDKQYFYIVDRLKELIKYKGFQVAPAELEALLLTHPKIEDAGVVGVPHADVDVGELPLAFVVKKKNVDLSEEEVEDFILKRVSSQKRLRGGVVFVSTIPKSPSGKILRRELKTLLARVKSKM